MKTNENLLIKSLKYISEFPTQVHATADEYLKIHNRNIEELNYLAKERNSKHLIRLVNSFEPISKIELSSFIEQKQQNIGLFEAVAGKLVGSLFKFAKNKGNTSKMIEQKVKQIAETSIKLAKIVENPFYEKVYDEIY